MNVEIPKGRMEDDGQSAPYWVSTTDHEGNATKPLIRCKCGVYCGIGLHHVHADGTVTRSFFHSEADSFTENGKIYSHVPGCGWHVWLKLKDYDRGDFPPEP